MASANGYGGVSEKVLTTLFARLMRDMCWPGLSKPGRGALVFSIG
jgi:hypothetical protein